VSVAVRRVVLHATRDCSPGRTDTLGSPPIVAADVVIRSAVAADATAIHTLIVDHTLEGRLLPRSVDDIALHIDRFVVATLVDDRRGPELVRLAAKVVGCADLVPLSSSLAEVRSLVVDRSARANGIGRRLMSELAARARATGFDALCAFTHAPAYFVQGGFSLVPHAWLPEKVERDCRSCSSFRRCGQSAVLLPLAVSRRVGADRQVDSANVVRLKADPANEDGDASRIAFTVASNNG
jgi:N-acetylglutamate synthase-like GNAT family acetyltransferase